MLRLSADMIIAVDEKGCSFKVLALPELKPVKRHWLSPECVDLCGYELRRPHLTCGCCGWRLLKEGKIGPVEACTPYFLTIMSDRGHRRLKRWALKKLCSMAEYVANK
jgi:hypothetical protein